MNATKRQEEGAAKDLDSGALAARLAELADSKGATEIVVLDMRKLVSYTDYLAICTARNERQARAIADEVKLRLKQEQQLLPAGAEVTEAAGWIVLDYLDCVLHVFTEEETPNWGISSIVARPSAPRLRNAAATSASEIPARRATARRASSVTRCGSRQLSRPTAASAPITNTSSLSPRSFASSSKVSYV